MSFSAYFHFHSFLLLQTIFLYSHLVLQEFGLTIKQSQSIINTHMRYIMKGGVWKNSQDQILKAAIMKYGLNQWSRISSLLQRKSAKQCKQRWYEWLDPSIKKTEWTRAEDQKLLQLARVFPSQWRTIAPFVGRTPTQCYERYEKLLDMAQGKSIKQAEDLRRLRPGQIDPNPQTKPARLDPIDMDEDEKEMLAEVRVRLANTKGKKAKRKEREKIIEEARRLAQLQKIRELEMAGVENIPTAKQLKRLRQKKDIDYNKQIPFKRDVPEFVYQTEESETPRNVSFASTITLQTLEGKRRDVEEELQRKLDRRRMKKFRQRDLKAAMQLKNQIARPASLPISLPEPQINEKDLQNMKKFNITTPLNTLLSELPAGMTPQNKILYSARVNLSLNRQDMTPIDDQLDGIEGLRTLRQMQQSKGQPMRSLDRVISERMKTPLNQWEQDHRKVKSLFKNLSKPQNVIEFDIPEEEDEEDEDAVIDAEQLERQAREKQKFDHENRLKLQTEVIKRQLPRPKTVPTQIKQSSSKAKQLVEQEMLSLIYSDAIDNPVEGIIFPENPPEYKTQISYQKLEQARNLVEQELASVLKQISLENKFSQARRFLKLDYSKKQTQLVDQAVDLNTQQALEQFEECKMNLEEWKSVSKHSEGAEKKTKKLLAGYQKLIKTKTQEINTLMEQLSKVRREKITINTLQEQEVASMQARIAELETYYRLVYNSI